MRKRLQLTIYGDVHGVSFRYYTREQASALGLTGWVRNANRGTVELVAEGDRPALEQLRDWCRQGPAWARVERVAEAWAEATAEFSGFQIKF